MSSFKEISVIIPTLNEEHYLPSVLAGLVQQKFNGKLQVIVVDGHSDDKTVEKAKTFIGEIDDITIIETDRGVSYQRNQGALHAKYEYLLFLDSDIILPPDFLNTLVKKLPVGQSFVSLVLHLPVRFNVLDYIWLATLFSFVWIAQFSTPICSGSFLFTTKGNHSKIGGFNNKIVMAEDVDYCKRSLAEGAIYRLYFRPHVLAYPRRLREIGRIKLLLLWLKGYHYTLKNGPIYSTKDLFEYQFGNHSKPDSQN